MRATLPLSYDDARDRPRLVARLAREAPGWQVESIDGTVATLVKGTPSSRPGATAVTLAPGTTAAAGHHVAERLAQQGFDLIEMAPYGDPTAVAGHLTATTRATRERYAQVLKCAPWDIELSVEWAADAVTGLGRIDRVVLVRVPTPTHDADRRAAIWHSLVYVTPGGSAGWRVGEAVDGVVTLAFGVAASLPELVARAALLPDRLDPEGWATIPLGVGGDGRPVGLSLAVGPHSLVVGPTGSGKTVELLQNMVSALTRGHSIVLIDPIKGGIDFAKIKPWMTAVATSLPEAEIAIKIVYVELQRRREILMREEIGNWAELPAAIRQAENIVPLTVVIDEFGSLVLEEKVPGALPRDHPERVAAEARNLARAMLLNYAGSLAREARFAGIFLSLAIQRPDASVISGELRSNLTSAVQLAAPGKPLSLDALRMVFPGEFAGLAFDALQNLDDGHSRGLAVTAAEGGSLQAFRVGFAPAIDNPALLLERGVPQVEAKWDLAATPAPINGRGSTPAPDVDFHW